MIAVASSFLGGSLLFVEKVSTKPIFISLIFLMLGWISLVISLIAVVFIRYQNIKSLHSAVSETGSETKKMKSSVKLAKKLSIWAIIFLNIGITFIMTFGAINIVAKNLKEEIMVNSDEPEKKIDESTEEKYIDPKPFIKKPETILPCIDPEPFIKKPEPEKPPENSKKK
jgi:hypothetical protein